MDDEELTEHERANLRRLLGDADALRHVLALFGDRQAEQLRELLQEQETVGSPKQLRRITALVYEQTLTVVPTMQTAVGPIDTQEERQHAFYLVSAFQQTTANEGVVSGGTFGGAIPNVVVVTLERRYLAGPPTKIATYLQLYNTKASSVDVHVKVYRVPGLR